MFLFSWCPPRSLRSKRCRAFPVSSGWPQVLQKYWHEQRRPPGARAGSGRGVMAGVVFVVVALGKDGAS